jgi:hypothetical protein
LSSAPCANHSMKSVREGGWGKCAQSCRAERGVHPINRTYQSVS